MNPNEIIASELKAVVDRQTAILDSIKGKVVKDVTLVRDSGIGGSWTDGDRIDFFFEEGPPLRMYHERDCCERVEIVDITGDLEDLVGQTLLLADVSCSQEPLLPGRTEGASRWTFYRFGTHKGYVTIRWCGRSSGYYSVVVDLIWL